MGIVPTIMAGLATYGVAKLLAEYDGAFNSFSKLRDLFMPRCAVCIAVWVAIPISIYAHITLLSYLAIIGGIVIMEEFR